MLSDAAFRRKAAKEIARDAMRGDDGDPMGELDALSLKLIGHAHVYLAIPVADPVETRKTLLFLAEELPQLIAEMDRIPSRRSKSMFASSKLHVWSKSFKTSKRKRNG